MDEQEPRNSQPADTPVLQDQAARPRTMHWTMVAIPAAALVIGLLIGTLVASAGNRDDNDTDGDGDAAPGATQTVTVSPTANPTEDTTIVVPQECVDAAETVQEATQLLRDNISAIQDFQAQQIVDMLNELEDLTDQANQQARTCTETTVAPTPSTTTATP